MTRRRNFDDAMNAPATPEREEPTGCCAFGCPLPAGIIRDGKRFCCVHLDVAGFDRFSAATAEIRKRQGLVDAILMMRAPGFRLDQQIIDDARRLWPELSADPKSPYALLVEAESRMRQACLGGVGGIYRTDDSVTDQIRAMADARRMPG